MSTSNEIRAAAVDYRRRGWAPIPIAFGSKAPILPGWDELILTETTLGEYFSGNVNIGVRLGEPSGGLVDIDLDSPEAVFIAAVWSGPLCQREPASRPLESSNVLLVRYACSKKTGYPMPVP